MPNRVLDQSNIDASVAVSAKPTGRIPLTSLQSQHQSKIGFVSLSAISESEILCCRSYEKEKYYLNSYLKELKNEKTGKYKSVQISPLRYGGGKSKAVGLILENLPKLNKKRIVSLFFGGGSVELCLCQDLGFEI